MSDPISREEHDEFAKRMDTVNERQNHRIELLEQSVREIGTLTVSVERLAVSMENMAKEQARQGERLEELEDRDGERLRQIASYITTTIIGIVIGIVVKQLGL